MFLNRHLTEGSIFAYAPPSLCHIDGEEDGFATGASMDAIADQIAAQLGDDGDEDAAAVGDTNPAGDGGDSAPAEGQPSADDTGSDLEPAEGSPIEPPLSWTKEDKEHWGNLPRETQEIIHSREKARDAEVRRTQNEVAEIRKAVEPERAALAQERQRYADQLGTYIALTEQLDPILAEGQKMDWAKAAQDDPAGTQAKWFQFQTRQGELITAAQQRDQIMRQSMEQHFAKEGQALIEKIPEWSGNLDAAKTGIDTLRKVAVDRYGFSPQEVTVIRDHRVALILKDAAAYHDLVATQAKEKADRALAEKATREKRQNPAPRLAASSVPQQGSQLPARSALRQRAKDGNASLDDRADAVLALLDG